MGTVNAVNPKVDLTVRLYDDFYRTEIEVPANEYDAVNSFFLKSFRDANAARNFTMALFSVSRQTLTPVLVLLDEIKDQDRVKLTATMAYYLNGLRSPSTLLGVYGPVVPNVWAARNVVP